MYYRKKLSNGLRIIGEKMPQFRSVSMGIWVKTGSDQETKKENGMSHFIEHMLFKGTPKRSAKEISVDMDAIGGQINAFTAKNCTCFYVKVLDEYMAQAMDILSDLFLHSSFDAKEMEKEKGVILEEIRMMEDTPDDVVHQLLVHSFYGNSPLGQTILGPAKNIQGFSKEDMLSYVSKHYQPENTVFALAGNFDEEKIEALCQQYFGFWQKSSETTTNKKANTPQPAAYTHKKKSIEQVHLCLGYKGFAMDDPMLYPLLHMNNVLGGGMSSRLFQSIREESGLAYSVYAYPSAYIHTGMMTIYAGTGAEHLEKVLDLIHEEIVKIQSGGITEQEFKRANAQLKASYLLGLESTSVRMNAIGRSELLLGSVQTPDEVLQQINAVTMAQVKEATTYAFAEPPHVVTVGKAPPDFNGEKWTK